MYGRWPRWRGVQLGARHRPPASWPGARSAGRSARLGPGRGRVAPCVSASSIPKTKFRGSVEAAPRRSRRVWKHLAGGLALLALGVLRLCPIEGGLARHGLPSLQQHSARDSGWLQEVEKPGALLRCMGRRLLLACLVRPLAAPGCEVRRLPRQSAGESGQPRQRRRIGDHPAGLVGAWPARAYWHLGQTSRAEGDHECRRAASKPPSPQPSPPQRGGHALECLAGSSPP